MDILYAHLHRWMAEPFVWGGSDRIGASDCMLVLADYLVSLGYPDLGAKWRGQYDSRLSCQKVTGFLTDPVKVVAEGCATVPIPMTDNPKRGDIGVVRVATAEGVYTPGAIYLGKNWAFKGEHRVVIGPAIDVLAAWSVARA